MDRDKYSSIGHRQFLFCNPISDEKFNKIINLLELKSDDKVLDIGAGKFEILIRLIEKYNIKGTGIEIFDGYCKLVEQQISDRISTSKIEIVNEDAKEFIKKQNDYKYDHGICTGATHIFGGFINTIDTLKQYVKSGGYLLIGDCYWKKEPSKEYLEVLGADISDYNSHYNNIQLGEELGLIPLWSTVANQDEWDEYECGYTMSVENYCYENPEDADCKEMLQRIRNWRKIYFNMGRDTLGFGLYLFRNQ